jgi:threonine/homoserine/homoserine lactone efflux protein
MILLIGILISFLGQLPVGYINLIAIKTTVEQSVKAALLFALGIAIVEALYLSIIMYSLYWIFTNKFIYQLIQVFTGFVFIGLGIISFLKWKNNKAKNHFVSKKYPHHPFLNGIVLSCINFAQFPFWLLWTSYLINTKILTTNTNQYPAFIIGTGIGTMLGLIIYIFGGKYLLSKKNNLIPYVDLLIAIFFIIAGLYQIYLLTIK